MTEKSEFVYRVNYELETAHNQSEPMRILRRADHFLYKLGEPPVIPRQGEYIAFKDDLLSTDIEWLKVKNVFHGITPGPLGDLQHHWVTVLLTADKPIPE